MHILYYKNYKLKKYRKNKKIKFDSKFNLRNFLDHIEVPKNKILFLHVGLRNLRAISNKTYEELTNDIIDYYVNKYYPFAIVVPTFTWSFRKTGLYSIEYSKSETGMFSELFRSKAIYRTSNAIQSFSIITNNEQAFRELNHADTFSTDGIYEFFRQNDTYIIDIATDTFRASPLHHIERVCDLCYLSCNAKKYTGYFIDENNNITKIEQMHGGTNIYKGSYVFNKEKIEKYIEKKKILVKHSHGAITLSVVSNQDLHRILEEKLIRNPFFAITL